MDPVKIVYYALPLVVAVLVAAIYTFGYPLLITLAVAAAFLGIFAIVGLTALDLVNGMKVAKPKASARAAAQSA